MRKRLLVSFVGPSCVGKSTCYALAQRYLARRGYAVLRLDLAEPLRAIQSFSHSVFLMQYPGYPYQPETFRQDGTLLAFLAGHFQERLTVPFLVKMTDIIGAPRQGPLLAIINTDCRNNAHPVLQELGFSFIRLQASPGTLHRRRLLRDDITPPDPRAAIEQSDQIKTDRIIVNEGTPAELEAAVRKELEELVDD